MSLQFEPWPKMGRLTRECIITEKIDGTNAQVNIVTADDLGDLWSQEPLVIANNGDGLYMLAGSRTRYVTPDNDNFGFAAWVKANADELFALGPGRHFGEWWGSKIQRGYGLTEKRFSLFNTSRWADRHMGELVYIGEGGVGSVPAEGQQWAPACCYVVPVLYKGLFGDKAVDNMLAKLRAEGSQAVPFMNPEGVVIFHTATGTMFKKLLENDERPKGAQ